MSENVYDIHFNMPEEDVILLRYALQDYRVIFNKDCETGQRLDKIMKILDIAVTHAFMDAKKEEQ